MRRSGFQAPTKEKMAELREKKLERIKAKASTKKPRKSARVPSQRQLKDKLWNEVKRITRERFEHTCYTCGAQNLEGSNLHSGHGKTMGALPLRYKYDIRNIRPQCMVCNVHRGGMSDIFIAKLEQEPEGLLFLNEACYLDVDSNAWRIRQDIPSFGGKDATIFIQNLLQQYKNTHY